MCCHESKVNIQMLMLKEHLQSNPASSMLALCSLHLRIGSDQKAEHVAGSCNHGHAALCYLRRNRAEAEQAVLAVKAASWWGTPDQSSEEVQSHQEQHC